MNREVASVHIVTDSAKIAGLSCCPCGPEFGFDQASIHRQFLSLPKYGIEGWFFH
jgi:hypothetical protein